jgi:hypothetical protein
LPYHGIKPEDLIWIFGLLVVGKIIIACVIALIAWRRRNKSLYINNYEEEFVQRALKKIQGIQLKDKNGHPAVLALMDLFRPIFIISLAVTGLFLYFSTSDLSDIGLYIMRPVAAGFIFFYFSRTLTLDSWLLKLENSNFHSFSLSCQSALAKIKATFYKT